MGMETGLLIFLAFVTFICFVLFMGMILLFLLTQPYPNLECVDDSEKYFYNTEQCFDEKFPLLNNRPTVTLSVIVPAYHEEKRLGKMLDEAIPFLEARVMKRPSFKYEVIIVDDGSDDGTATVALDYCKRYTSAKVRLLKLVENRGKGGAVRRGMLSARGELLLFADADGATKFSDLEKLEAEITSRKSRHIVVCGSRAHLQDDAIVKRSALRNLLMYGFHMLVWLCCVRNIKDTQCGFKLFTRDAAIVLFNNLHVERWAFDCDLLYLANQFNMLISEIPVAWTEIEGSKIIPVFSWAQMGLDIILIRLRYMLGVWKIESRHRLE